MTWWLISNLYPKTERLSGVLLSASTCGHQLKIIDRQRLSNINIIKGGCHSRQPPFIHLADKNSTGSPGPGQTGPETLGLTLRYPEL